jgi:hypothetical protein
MKHLFFTLTAWFALAATLCGAQFKFGVARVDITPDYPIRLSGYAARKTVSEGVQLPLSAKALALSQENDETALLITIDNVGISREIRDEIVRRIRAEHSIPLERIVIFSSHTHSAPVLTGAIANIFAEPIPEAQRRAIARYTRELSEKVIAVANSALRDLRPCHLFWGKGNVGFAKNRRTAGGPVDHDMPILVVRGADNSVKAVLANYACHCTTLQGDRNLIHGDWAGIAQRDIEQANPGAIGLISIGCGADSNPFPRGAEKDVLAHGKELASEVQRLLGSSLTELTEPLEFHAKPIDLPFDSLPTREEWEKRATEIGIVGYHARLNLERLDRGEKIPTSLPYFVAAWNFGKQLEMVFLAGEVVVDYSLRLKRELDENRLWVSGYSNWVPCYIPSGRILKEGGYEAETSLWYYDRPARLSTNTESLIIGAVESLVPASFRESSAK